MKVADYEFQRADAFQSLPGEAWREVDTGAHGREEETSASSCDETALILMLSADGWPCSAAALHDPNQRR